MSDETGVTSKAYPTDLSNEQCALIEALIPPAKLGVRPCGVEWSEVLNSILFLHPTGCEWEMLSHDLRPKSTV